MIDAPDPSLTPDEARPYIVDMLDDIRKQEQRCALGKAQCILLARRYDLPFAEIAELLDMSEQGVRKAFKRIEASTPAEVR
jgi:DNA-directed RNA polymerase specialized sigma24 family protein